MVSRSCRLVVWWKMKRWAWFLWHWLFVFWNRFHLDSLPLQVGTEILEDQITAFEDYVQSMDVAAFNKIWKCQINKALDQNVCSVFKMSLTTLNYLTFVWYRKWYLQWFNRRNCVCGTVGGSTSGTASRCLRRRRGRPEVGEAPQKSNQAA